MKIRHKVCNHLLEISFNNFKSGNRCPKCAGNLKSNTLEFKEYISNETNNEYELLSDYINSQTKVDILHKVCNQVQSIKPNRFKLGDRCSYCSNKRKKDTNRFKDEVKELGNNEYEVLSEYVNSDTYIKMKHLKCGNIYSIKPYLFVTGRRCNSCRSSKGEETIFNILNDMGIEFIKEYRFDDCRDKLPLPFDFYLLNNNLLIEYDGVQHFKPSFKFKNESDEFKRYEDRLKKDNIKNEYCKSNNIDLLRIPYTEFNNIETIIKDYLRK